MSLNIQERDLITGELKRTIVAGNSNIVDTAIEIDSTWSSKKISADLADKQDFRIFNSLEEFNEKKGTSLTVVSGIDNMKDIVNAMSNGEMLIIIIKYELSSEVYFGLTTSTGWTKMFTFIKSNGLCDVECRTTFPLTLKRVLNSDGVIGDWQKLVTESDINISNVFDETNHTIDVSALEQYGYGTYEIYGQGNDGHGIVRVHIWKAVSGTTVYEWEKMYSVNQPTTWFGGNSTYVVNTISCDTSCMNYCDMIKKLSY